MMPFTIYSKLLNYFIPPWSNTFWIHCITHTCTSCYSLNYKTFHRNS